MPTAGKLSNFDLNNSVLCLPKSVGVIVVVFHLVLAAIIGSSNAYAQATAKVIPFPKPRPQSLAPQTGGDAQAKSLAQIRPIIPNFKGDARLNLVSKLSNESPPIQQNVIWRIFGKTRNKDGKLPLLATATGGAVAFDLPANTYFVHASFGHAGKTERIDVIEKTMERTFILQAGGIRLNAVFRDGDPVPVQDVSFDIFLRTDNGDRLITKDALSDEIVRLNEATYHVVSKYGKINSESRADLQIKPGKLTDVTMYQQGAEVTLKLVSEDGGDALANTAWSVMTPAGDTILESLISAFPSVILATGEYAALARHDGQVYTRNFTVENGVHRDVEVLLNVTQ